MLGFGLLFVRQRGGGALVAKLAENLSLDKKHHEILMMRRVFGGRVAQAILRIAKHAR